MSATKPPDATPVDPSSVLEAEFTRLAVPLGQGWDPSRIRRLCELYGTGRVVQMARAAAGNPWYRTHPQQRRADVMLDDQHLPELVRRTQRVPVEERPKPAPTAALCRDLAVGSIAPGGLCAWCNRPQTFAWDGSDFAADPEHAECRTAAAAWDRKRGMTA